LTSRCPPPPLLLILLLAACGSRQGGEAPPPAAPDTIVVRDPAVISYESRGCYGTCPIYKVAVWRDGRGLFIGHQHVTVVGVRQFRLSPDQYQRFADWLAPLKPARGSVPREGTECNILDGSSFAVEWEGADGARQSFCVGSHDQLPDPRLANERIRGAPDLLPIAAWIGPG
jgi:hypothetical protein